MDTEFVNKIVEQVISALGQQGPAAQPVQPIGPDAPPCKISKPTDGHLSASETRRANCPETRIASPPTIGLIIDRPEEKVRSIVDSLSREQIDFARFDRSSCWMENLRSMCQAVTSGELVAGVVIMPWAADAMVLANKIKGVRAVQGTRIESVKAGLRRFGANVLILEHAASTFHELRTMIRVFAKDRSNQATSRHGESPVATGLLLKAVSREETS